MQSYLKYLASLQLVAIHHLVQQQFHALRAVLGHGCDLDYGHVHDLAGCYLGYQIYDCYLLGQSRRSHLKSCYLNC